jgi:hypothetical protein
VTKPAISQGEIKAHIAYDHLTGAFTWATSRVGVKAGKPAGNISPTGYRRICINRVLYLAHRLAWVYVTGTWPTGDIDHIDGNPSNNAFSNLRDVPTAMNVQNVHKARSDTKHSSLIGVGFHKRDGLWRARIRAGGKRRTVGYFSTEAEAGAAYLAAKQAMHAGYVGE